MADELVDSGAVRIAHDSEPELSTSVRIPDQRTPSERAALHHQRHLDAIAALDTVAPQVVRIANATRVMEMHLAIRDAIQALEAGQVELALKLLRDQQSDKMPTRGRKQGPSALDLGTS